MKNAGISRILMFLAVPPYAIAHALDVRVPLRVNEENTNCLCCLFV